MQPEAFLIVACYLTNALAEVIILLCFKKHKAFTCVWFHQQNIIFDGLPTKSFSQRLKRAAGGTMALNTFVKSDDGFSHFKSQHCVPIQT